MRMTAALTAFLWAGAAVAAPAATPVEWTFGEATYSGFVVRDATAAGPQPGLLMVPNWLGVTESAVEKARSIAAEGYVVLVADMYGKGQRPADHDGARQAVRAVYASGEIRGRAAAALEALRGQAGVDPERLGALGFCFGGSTVLELARSGVPLGGVVSLHGGLDTAERAGPGGMSGPVLVLNGADDTAVTSESILAFETEMREAGADWQFVNFGGAVHCFAEPDADRPPNCLYHAPSAQRAYRMMYAFFEEAFGTR